MKIEISLSSDDPIKDAINSLLTEQRDRAERKALSKLILELSRGTWQGVKVVAHQKPKAEALMAFLRARLELLDKPNDAGVKRKLKFAEIQLDKASGTNPFKVVK